MQRSISISQVVLQALQLACLAGAQPACEPAEAVKGKAKGSTQPFSFPFFPLPVFAVLLSLATVVTFSTA